MAREVHGFTEHELPGKDVESEIGSPRGWRIRWVQEEVHRHKSEERPVVSAILDDIGPGHGVVGEAMDEECLVLTFTVVHKGHGDSKLLDVEQLRVRPVDLLAEQEQEESDEDRTGILNQEDSRPGDLHSQIFEDKLDLFKIRSSDIVAQLLSLVRKCRPICTIDAESYPLGGEALLSWVD